MGTRADGSGHFICPSDSHQVPSAGRFHCRIDQDPNAASSRRPRVLDDVLRRITNEERRRHGASLCFAPRGTHEVHGLHPFPASNNVAKYEALINGLRIAIELGIRWLNVRGDSQLVIDQVMKESSYHNAKMAAYYHEVQ